MHSPTLTLLQAERVFSATTGRRELEEWTNEDFVDQVRRGACFIGRVRASRCGWVVRSTWFRKELFCFNMMALP